MIKVAFCDDDLSVLNQLNTLIDKYRVERNQDIVYADFNSPLELMAQIEKGLRLDVLFLDVVMPGENGIEVAREIRQYDTNMKIIFLTSSAEYAVESYAVGAYFY
ncbi:MAG: response regulator, partial [Lachnospiraceae bacterium]|nr:response regulator [Lachnospiraceae bacterium]